MESGLEIFLNLSLSYLVVMKNNNVCEENRELLEFGTFSSCLFANYLRVSI